MDNYVNLLGAFRTSIYVHLDLVFEFKGEFESFVFYHF